MNNYSVIAFDLDNTLAKSKSGISERMSALLPELLKKKKVAVISGGAFHQFKVQIIDRLAESTPEILVNLIMFPTNGSSLYLYKDGNWECEYEEKLTQEEKEKIANAWDVAISQSGIVLPTPSYGPVMEDRVTQISFSACGQQAPYAVKSIWDPDQAKRTVIRNIMLPLLPQFSISLGGTSTIDVTQKGIDKAYAISRLMNYLKISKDDIMFIGDKLEPGGNDYAARSTGVYCASVNDPKETEDLIEKIISNK